jgi:hypothetical protein
VPIYINYDYDYCYYDYDCYDCYDYYDDCYYYYCYDNDYCYYYYCYDNDYCYITLSSAYYISAGVQCISANITVELAVKVNPTLAA